MTLPTKDIEGKTIAKVTLETIDEQGTTYKDDKGHTYLGETYDRLTIRFTDGTEVKFRSQFNTTLDSGIYKEDQDDAAN